MPSLKLHQVLEEEYVAMYGPLKLGYDEGQIVDAGRARAILRACGIAIGDHDSVAHKLTELVTTDVDLSPLKKSPVVCGELHIANRDRRAVVDEAFAGAVMDPTAARLENVITAIHAQKRTGLCISGGGIRSATFALGVIQGFCRAGLLKNFDYLSTVSGGGYIGSWLSSWVRRDRDGVAGVEKALAMSDTAAQVAPELDESAYVNTDEELARQRADRRFPESKLDPEPRPLRHLREYSNYMSPRLGLLSGDSWTIVASYVRNLLLNLLVLVPLLAAVLAIPRWFSWALAEPRRLTVETLPWMFTAFVAFAFAYIGRARPVEYGQAANAVRKKWIANPDGRYLLFCVLPLTGAATMLALFWARVHALEWPKIATPNFLWALGASMFAMTALPYGLYYMRIRSATLAARRSGFIDEKAFRAHLVKKGAYELFGVIVALATSGALLWLLAIKVFDDVADYAAARAPDAIHALPRAVVPSGTALCLLRGSARPARLLRAGQHLRRPFEREERGLRSRVVGSRGRVAGVYGGRPRRAERHRRLRTGGPVLRACPDCIDRRHRGRGGGAPGLQRQDARESEREGRSRHVRESRRNVVSGIAVPLFVIFLLASVSFGSTWLIHQLNDAGVPDSWKLAANMQAATTSTEKVERGGISVESKMTLEAPLSNMPELYAAAHLRTVQTTSGLQLLCFLGVALAAAVLSLLIGVNKFSMHALYRNRLIRAYLGASRFRREPDSFTGFDEDDNLPVWSLRQELLWTTSIRDLDGFVSTLKGYGPLAKHIWEKLDEKTRRTFEEPPYGARPKETLIVNVNRLLLEDDFAKVDHVSVPDWVKPRAGEIGYSLAFRNRAILDAEFWQSLRAMPGPSNAKRDLPAEAVADARAPMHVVNVALNLTTGDNLAWQQRMAESFTISPMHSGSARIGYRSSREYGGPKGISLGTAVTISGAAASPNMGYHSSPVMAFLLTFFNVRLGAWLGNPGDSGEGSCRKAHPTTNLIPFAKEATGSSDARSKWVYLSDGGHFENLGLYEMVLRRCRYIVVSDAGADPTFSFDDLGNAIRKIRTDLGIPIDVYDMKMEPRGDKGQLSEGRFVAQAHIRYSVIDRGAKEDGTLIYIKAGVYKDDDLPRDIYNYAQESMLFPHEPTSDQFFSESQFESYRALGRYAVNELCGERVPPERTARIPIVKPFDTVEALFDRARKDAEQRRRPRRDRRSPRVSG